MVLTRCVHAVFPPQSCLKQYFRKLKVPVLTIELYSKWKELGNMDPTGVDYAETMLKEVRETIRRLPPSHLAVMEVLLPFLKTIAKHAEKNKMTTKNLAVVFGPTILRAPDGKSMEVRYLSPPSTLLCMLCTGLTARESGPQRRLRFNCRKNAAPAPTEAVSYSYSSNRVN